MSPLGHPSCAHPLGGAGSARPRGRHNANRNVPPFGHRPLANSSAIMTRSGLRPARIRGRGDRAPPRKSPLALSPGFPRKATSPRLTPRRGGLCTPGWERLGSPGISPLGDPVWAHPLGGAGSARPRGRRNANRNALSLRPPASRLPVDRHTIPRPASGLATRARRPRPSEKIALRVVFAPSPLGAGHCDWFPPGGAGSARPRGWLGLDRGICPLGRRLIIIAPMGTQCLGIRPAVPPGRGDRAPPRKPPLALPPGFPR